MTVCRAASIVVQDDHLEYFGPEGAHWRTPISRIRALGELRLRGLEDSHYLAVLIDDSGAWLQAPTRANGMERAMETLEQHFQQPLRFHLTAASAGTSRVLWPRQLAGEPLLDYGSVERISLTPRVQEFVSRT